MCLSRESTARYTSRATTSKCCCLHGSVSGREPPTHPHAVAVQEMRKRRRVTVMQSQQSSGAALQRGLNDLCSRGRETLSTVEFHVSDESSDEYPSHVKPSQGE
jgi:hypothetical protein